MEAVEVKCQMCGSRLYHEDYEPIDSVVRLRREETGQAITETIGVWCSEKCFLVDMRKQLKRI